MAFFRRSLDIAKAQPRDATDADLHAVSRLFRDGSHRFFSQPGSDLPGLLAGAPAVVLATESAVWGAAIAGWPVDQTCWLRGLAFANGVPLVEGFNALLPPFHALLAARTIRSVFYAGDASTDTWMQPGLMRRGYVRETDVVVYENRQLDMPAQGKQDISVRHAEPVDLPAVLAVDRAAFGPQWVKDEGVLGPAMADTPFFIVAELHGMIVGYTFATSHFNGRLIHLVRIAVHPSQQGQGIGVRLLAQVLAYARVSHAESLTLNTQQENRQAQRLYEWFGFQRTGERQLVLRYDI